MSAINRRHFLKQSTVVALAAGLGPRVWAQAAGANNDIRVGIIGIRGRGGSHIDAFSHMKGVRVVALCDADAHVLAAGAKHFADQSKPVTTYADVRKLLENKDIDVVSTATPNHWHALITVWACQAGKDVYVEKPISHNVWEGRQAVDAARKYKRIVQAGTQSRSNETLRAALDWVRAGNLGKIKIARGLCYKRRPSIGKVDGPQPIPAYIDYDLWCGPALKLPLMRKNLHYDWHWVWNTGNGDMGNQGIHEMDVARWALGKTELSPRILSVGGRLGYQDDGETPNTEFTIHDYGDALLIFEVRGLPDHASDSPNANGAAAAGTGTITGTGPGEKMDRYRGQSIGDVIECENGYLAGTIAYDLDGREIKKFTGKGETNHFANFIEGVRSRNIGDLHADILEGHLSSALCHTGNISYRRGKEATPDEIEAALKANPAALETLGRFEEHLARNKVDLKLNKATLGMSLQMDPRTERFIGDEAANALLTRDYRAPFVVPKEV